MILNSIQVEGWRCFASPFSVGEFGTGLNIIHGPNGIGKSTIMMALARGLFDSHHVGGEEIKSLRPWGRELAPKVMIEFEQDGQQFRLRKQFLESASSKLFRQENGRFEPIAEGRGADERARKILAGQPSSRGASDQRHWGLAQILWAPQGSLEIEELTSKTRATIQDALGAQIVGAGTESLEQRINSTYARFFAASGKLRKGSVAPPIVNLELELVKAKAAQAKCQQDLRDFETASQRIEDLRQKQQTATQKRQELNRALQSARHDVQKYQILKGQQKQHQAEVAAANERHRNVADQIQAIRDTDTQRATASNQLKQMQIDLPACQQQLKQCQETANSASQALKAIRERRSEVAKARRLATIADQFNRHQVSCLDLEKRLKQVEATEGRLKQLDQSHAAIVAPDKKTLKKIITVERRRENARSKLDAALIRVSLTLDSDREIEITQAELAETRTFSKNETHEIKGAPDVAFRIPGVGQFRATGPTSDFDSLHKQWESATEEFEALTGAFGTCEISALETLHSQAEELEQEMAQATYQLKLLLDGQEAEKLRADLVLSRNRIDEILLSHPDWKISPPVVADVGHQAEVLERKIAQEIEAAEQSDDRAKESLRRQLLLRDNLTREIVNLESSAAALAERLKTLRKDGLDDDRRATNLREIALQRDIAAGKLDQVEKQIGELGDDPVHILAGLEQQQQELHAQVEEAEKALNHESGRLERMVSEAPYSALNVIEEEIARLEEDIARQRLEIEAIRLLYDTVAEQKQEVMQSLIDPIRNKANRILRRIDGSRFDDVQFDKNLLPTGIAPRSQTETVALKQISGGEQEQVHFAVRMALADVAFSGDRELLVLDDVFTYTDASRLTRIVEILEEWAERFQIILLTCHPERYQRLEGAQFFDLEQIATSRVQKVFSFDGPT
jgi:DNA repair exonuclease SbcCD ATPase subunit